MPSWSKNRHKTFLNEDYCVINDGDFFVRGLIHLPIIGAAETFRWGVWGSLSRENFEALLKKHEDPKRIELPPMFSWLSTQLPEYPDTLNLKMYAHIQEPGWRPHFRLELTDHPLSQEHHKGITPERVKEITMARLRTADWKLSCPNRFLDFDPWPRFGMPLTRQVVVNVSGLIAKLGTVPTADLVMTSSGGRDPGASAPRRGLVLPNRTSEACQGFHFCA